MASCGILLDSQNNVLITRRSSNQSWPNAWVNAGGHVEFNEPLEYSCILEISEETGIEIERQTNEKTNEYQYLYQGKEVILEPLMMFESVWNFDFLDSSPPLG